MIAIATLTAVKLPDKFRKSEHCADMVLDIVTLFNLSKLLWNQLID